MLVLTRNSGESICIGDDIEITVLEIVGESVRLAISTSKNDPTRREEVRFPGQPIPVSKDSAAMVVDNRYTKVRLGITAPRHASVARKEVRQSLNDDQPPKSQCPQ